MTSLDEQAVPATQAAPHGEPDGQPPPGDPGLRWRQAYRGEEAQIGKLRRWVAGLLPECPARDDVILVAAELAANAVKHTASGRDGWFAAEVGWRRTAVRIVIADQGAPSAPRLIDDPMAEHGRGLRIVQALAARTGVAGDEQGRLVWAEVPWAGAAAEAATFPGGCEAGTRDGHDLLAQRHTGAPAWFGHATLQWWAMAGYPDSSLVAVSSPGKLSWLLDTLQLPDPPQRAAAVSVRGDRDAAGPGWVPR